MPNGFAFLVLFAWPLAVIALFFRLPPQRALVWSLLGGYLLLPQQTGVNLPMVPTLNRDFVPALSALLCLTLIARQPLRLVPRSPVALFLLALMLLGPVATLLYNGEPVPIGGGRVLKGVDAYDTASTILGTVASLLPFLLARQMLGSEASQRELLGCLMLAALFYSLPMLLEIRLSPQLHNWIYGFYQHSFAQQVRAGGYRPMVFLQHGLWAALFVAMALIAAATLWRTGNAETRRRALPATGWLLMLLVLCKSFGAFGYALIGVPLVRFATQRVQMTVAVCLVAVALAYPALRGADLVPVRAIEEFATGIDVERGGSLGFRLNNEDILLERARLKPLVGWGGWGRARVYNPENGEDISTTDGRWVIVFGNSGWLGYISEFGLLALPVLLLARRRNMGPEAAALSLILAVNMLDLLPNAGLTPVTWIVAGSLLARAEARKAAEPPPARVPAAAVAAARPRSVLSG